MSAEATVAMLAIRAAAGRSGWRKLGEKWLNDHSFEPSLSDPLFIPSEENWALAKAQGAVLRAMGIACWPIWQWTQSLLRSRPYCPLLFYRGSLDIFNQPILSIVGARKASNRSLEWTEEAARTCAESGVAIVSGGALGIDAAAHRGALAGKGLTASFLGVPCDKIYPSCHRTLFSQILSRGGALLSEHGPRETTFAFDHAKRNRFISSAARQVLVVEAGLKSGTLGTAREARSQGVGLCVSPPGIAAEHEGLDFLIEKGWARPWSEQNLGDLMSQDEKIVDAQCNTR